MVAFCTEMKKKYPKLYFKDEYRFPPAGERNEHTTGAHFHLQLR